MDDIGALILAAGTLGTTAFGLIEAFKWTFIGLFGFDRIPETLGTPLYQALEIAYGTNAEKLLKALYKGEQQELLRTIRQGVRIGLTPENATAMAAAVNVVEAAELTQAARLVQAGEELPAALRNVLGKFELAVDARIDAALTLALNHYTSKIKLAAAAVALGIALGVGLLLYFQTGDLVVLAQAIFVGLVAVPIAPVAKDVVTAIQSISSALRRR